MNLSFGSVCSGIEAASVAWHPLGFRAAWFAEIEPFPSAVLAHHYPTVPNLGDMTAIADKVRAGEVEAPDVLVGGTPCQAFSVAGLRNSLDDARGQLSLEFVRLANEIDSKRSVLGQPACVVVWENVPGVLSTKDNAFGCFLGALSGEDGPIVPAGKKWTNAGCVFGPERTVAWRVTDAQYFGVAQRRRRVFVVASADPGFDPANVLFESEGVRRDTAPRREPWQNFAGTAAPGIDLRNGVITGDVTHTLQAGDHAPDPGGTPHVLSAPICVHGTQDPCVSNSLAFALGRNNGGENAAMQSTAVRRLTPVECERLQAFPDGYTQVPHRGKPAADGPRYKALGNSMCVSNMRHWGERIKQEKERVLPLVHDQSTPVSTNEKEHDMLLSMITVSGDTLADECHRANAKWWTDLDTGEDVRAWSDKQRNLWIMSKLALVHSEVSEAVEGLRKGVNDDHLKELPMFQVELADAAIRIFDLAGGLGIPLGAIMAKKMEYNAQRADHKVENRKAAGGKSI